MQWEAELEEIARRQKLAEELGGSDKIERQHQGGRLTVRERVTALLDSESFQEIGAFAGVYDYDDSGQLSQHLPSNCVMGRGRIAGRPVVVAGDDFTIRGGSADAAIAIKAHYPEEMAQGLKLPIVRLIEGSGGGGSVKTIETKGRSNLPGGFGSPGYHIWSENLARVPVVALGLGSVAGLGAARLAASHYSIMVKHTSAVFVAGPPVVSGIGQELSKQELGGHTIQTRAGGVDDAVDNEQEAFARTRRFLSYLPNSVDELPPRADPTDAPDRSLGDIADIIPKDKRKVYKMRKIIDALVDRDSFFEMSAQYGRSIITGFARLNGWPVALMASDPYFLGGAWTAAACQKVTRFVDLAQTFHLPVVYLADCPGFHVGLDAEQAGTIRYGVRAMSAINQTSVPWCTIIVRNAYGVAGAAHRPTHRYSVRYAWMTARWGSLPLEGGIEAAYRAELDAAPDPAAKLEEIKQRLQRLQSPFRTAEPFWIEDIIDPSRTRVLLCDFADLAAPVREAGPSSFGMRP